MSALMEAPAAKPAVHQGATATAPGPAFGKMLQRGVAAAVPQEEAVPAPVSSTMPLRLRLSLLGADGFLVVLVVVFLAHTPLHPAFWREWSLGVIGLGLGGWLGWLGISAD